MIVDPPSHLGALELRGTSKPLVFTIDLSYQVHATLPGGEQIPRAYE
jgi:hypothetical protein